MSLEILREGRLANVLCEVRFNIAAPEHSAFALIYLSKIRLRILLAQPPDVESNTKVGPKFSRYNILTNYIPWRCREIGTLRNPPSIRQFG